jgi:formylglycine-generating enzyme required for sulfatase activity
MTGNVWEWCLDSYDPFAYRLHSKNNPVVTQKGSLRVFRGGSWYTEEFGCSVTNRAGIFSGNLDTGIGLRLVRVNELHIDKM